TFTDGEIADGCLVLEQLLQLVGPRHTPVLVPVGIYICRVFHRLFPCHPQRCIGRHREHLAARRRPPGVGGLVVAQVMHLSREGAVRVCGRAERDLHAAVPSASSSYLTPPLARTRELEKICLACE